MIIDKTEEYQVCQISTCFIEIFIYDWDTKNDEVPPCGRNDSSVDLEEGK